MAICVASASPVRTSRKGSLARCRRSFGAPLASEPEQESATLAGLRDRFECILLDCGSLHDSINLLRHASAADGVALVVEAGRTAKEQVEHAARVIREARGTLIGFVLNKRRYPVPGWLYRML
jgi:hypothetical protein